MELWNTLRIRYVTKELRQDTNIGLAVNENPSLEILAEPAGCRTSNLYRQTRVPRKVVLISETPHFYPPFCLSVVNIRKASAAFFEEGAPTLRLRASQVRNLLP
jgi:hypothetical protein